MPAKKSGKRKQTHLIEIPDIRKPEDQSGHNTDRTADACSADKGKTLGGLLKEGKKAGAAVGLVIGSLLISLYGEGSAG
jgi:hypothetical protein